jgi:hypothetical protein
MMLDAGIQQRNPSDLFEEQDPLGTGGQAKQTLAVIW